MAKKRIVFVHVLTVLCICFSGGYSVEGIITDPPVDSTTCYGGIAIFTCGSDRGSDIANIQWALDSQDDLNTTERGISTHTNITDEYAATTLTIVGLHDNHDIIVGCQMITTSFDSDTEVATFTVTDIPPVTNLTIEFTGATMITTWQAPTVLPVDYHYQINISYGSVLITNTTVDPVYIMDITSCTNTNYIVSVSVVDIGYTQLHSEYTTSTTEYDVYEVELRLKFGDLRTVTFVNSSESYISIDCDVNDMTCSEEYPQFIEQIESIIPSGITFNRTVDIVDSCKHKGYYSFGPYNDCFIGIMTVKPIDSTGTTVASQIGISTFHVQHFTLDVLSDTTVQLTCFFAVNSSADGCNVTFNSINQSVLVSVFIPKDNTIAVTNYTGIPEGDSVVNVYDVVEGVSNMSLPALKNLVYSIVYPGSYETTVNGGNFNVFSSTVTKSSSTGTSPSVTIDTPVATNYALVIIASVVGIVLIIVTLHIVVTIVSMKTSMQRKQVLSQERTLVRHNIAEPHDYTSAEELRKPAVEVIYHEHRSNFLPPNHNSHTVGSNNTLRSPPPTYENANNLFARKTFNSKPLDDDNSDDISEDNVSIAIEDCVIDSPVESTTDHTNGHLVMTSGPPPLPLKTTSFIKVPAGDKLDKSQYATVGFIPNEEVEGVRTRPLPAMPQPQSQYSTLQVQSSIVISMENCPHNENSEVVRNVDIHHVSATTTSTVGSVDEHSALIRGNNNTYNRVSEATDHVLVIGVKPYPCDTIQERLIPTESANIDECLDGCLVQEQVYDYYEEAVASKSQIILQWNEIFEDILSEVVHSLENLIHYVLEEVNPGNKSKNDDHYNLDIHGISCAVKWLEDELKYNFFNHDATMLVEILGHKLKELIYTCTSVVCSGSTYLPVFDVWLKRKIGLMCKSIDYGWRSLSLWKESEADAG